MKKFTLLLFSLLPLSIVIAQSRLSDKSFFIVDSLEFDQLESSDSSVIVHFMSQFHDVKHDTLQLAILEELFDNLWNEAAGKRYVLLMNSMALKGKQTSKNEKEFNAYLFYEGISYGNLGYLYDVHDEYAKAEKEYQKAEQIFDNLKAHSYLSQIKSSLGMIAEGKGNISLGIDLYTEAQEQAKLVNDTDNLIMANGNLAQLLSNMGEDKKAIEVYKENIRLLKQTQNSYLLANEYQSLAVSLYSLGDTTTAIEHIQKTLQIYKETKQWDRYYIAYANYGLVLSEIGKTDSAKSVIQDCIQFFESNAFSYELAKAYNKFGLILDAEGNLEMAVANYKKSLEIAEKINVIELRVRLYEKLAQAYSTMPLQDFTKAYYYLENFVIGRDSIRRAEYKTELLEQAISYEYEKEKELQAQEFKSEMELAEAKNENQRLLLLIGAIIILVIVIALFFIYRQLKTIKEQKVELDEAYQELEIRKNDEVLASNLKAIQSQMNPHFIFNALNSIQTFVLKGEVDSSYTYINQFADLIRTTLSFSDRELVSFQEEIELLENYLSLEKLRFREDFDYQIIAQNVPEMHIPPMLLQPLIENSLIHGLLHKPTDRQLSLNFQYTNGALSCEIVDNGIGREAAKAINLRKNKKHKSFAIGALKKRFEFLSKRFNMQVGFEHVDLFENGEARGTKVSVQIPFQLNP